MKVLMVIAPLHFQDKEYADTKKELESAGVQVEVISTRPGTCIGRFGLQVEAKGLEDVRAEAFDAIVYIGGPGTRTVRADVKLVNLAKSFADSGKLVCAICWAPTILAKAGVLKGKKSTVWFGEDPEYGKDTGAVLEQYGGIYEPKPVLVDGKIITADGPMSASTFGKEILKALKS